MGKANGGIKAAVKHQQRSGGGTGLPKGNGAPCWGLRGEGFTGRLAKEDQEVSVVVLVVFCCYFCLLTCGGFFPFQFQSQYLKAPSYLHLAVLCKQLIYKDFSGIVGIFSALICNKNNLNIKEFTITLRFCNGWKVQSIKSLLPQKQPFLNITGVSLQSHGEANSASGTY